MPCRVDAAGAGRAFGQPDLVLEAPVGLAEVVQEGDGAKTLDQPLIRWRQCYRRQQSVGEQRVAEQGLEGRGYVGAMVDERMPFEARTVLARSAKLPPSSAMQENWYLNR